MPTSSVPKLNMALLADQQQRRSTADGQVGSVSPRPIKKHANPSPFDEGGEGAASHPRHARSPSQPMLSLLEHTEHRQHPRTPSMDRGDDAASYGRSMVIHDLLFEGLPHVAPAAPTADHRRLGGDGSQLPPNPMRMISSVAMSDRGTHVAAGDRMGRVWLAERNCLRSSADDNGRRHDAPSFDFSIGKRCYVPVIDPLNSVEVSPVVHKLSFLPQLGPALHLLTTNEKVPKLYKIMHVRQTPSAPKAVSHIGSKVIGPLTSPQQVDTVAMKQVHHYAMDHEFTIHSICPTSEGTQFYSADDISVRQWCVEYPQSSIEVYSLKKPSGDGDVKELLRSVTIFPPEPSLCFLATTSGCVRVVDIREMMRWSDRDTLMFKAPPRSVADGPFMELTNAFSGCALSPCGRYLCARDFMSVPVWDIRMSSSATTTATAASPLSSSAGSPTGVGAGGLVARFELHPHLRPRFEWLYQADLLMERYDVQFLSSEMIATGSFDNVLCTIEHLRPNNDPADSNSAFDAGVGGARPIEDGTPPAPSAVVAGVKKYQLPVGPLPAAASSMRGGTVATVQAAPSNAYVADSGTGDNINRCRLSCLTPPIARWGGGGRVELCAAYGASLAHISF